MSNKNATTIHSITFMSISFPKIFNFQAKLTVLKIISYISKSNVAGFRGSVQILICFSLLANNQRQLFRIDILTRTLNI